jgi:hypothetical protein
MDGTGYAKSDDSRFEEDARKKWQAAPENPR